MRKAFQPSKVAASRFPTSMVLLAFAAFALGSAGTWLILRGSAVAPPPANPSAVAQPSTEQPPDTSQLAPAEAAVTLANWNYDRQNWLHAIEHYEQALALGLNTPDLRTDLGNCYRF